MNLQCESALIIRTYNVEKRKKANIGYKGFPLLGDPCVVKNPLFTSWSLVFECWFTPYGL